MDSAIPFLIFVLSSPVHAIYSQGVGNPSSNLAILTIFYVFKKRGPVDDDDDDVHGSMDHHSI